MNENEIQDNIDEFMEEHGVEGFFRLYFREYLFELLYEEVNAATGNPETDSGIQLHFSNQVTTNEELQQFEEQLRSQCASRADSLVSRIKANEELKPLFEDGNVELLHQEKTENMMTTAMHNIIQDWEDENQ